MNRKAFTAKYLRDLKPRDKAFTVRDDKTPLTVWVGKQKKTLLVIARWAGGNPTPRTIPVAVNSDFDEAKLLEARRIANDWVSRAKTEDPAEVAREAARLAASTRREAAASSFEIVVGKYFAAKLKARDKFGNKLNRNADKERKRIARYCSALAGKPLASIRKHDVLSLIEGLTEKGITAEAHNLLGNLRTFLGWAVERELMATNPAEMKAKTAVGHEKVIGERSLSDAEIKALYLGCEDLDANHAAIFRLLLLTGARKSEIVELRWSEVDYERPALVLPRERTKMKRDTVIPLSAGAIEVLKAHSKNSRSGDFVFTATGRVPLTGISTKWKRRLDNAIKFRLGTDPAPWVNHDLRRTVVAGLAKLGIAPHVRSAVLNHVDGEGRRQAL